MSAANRWLNWKPKTRIFSKVATTLPTIPTEPGFDGFVGATPGNYQKIEASSDRAIAEAMGLLNLAGVRILRFGADLQIGIWQDLDGPEVRAAIRAVALHVHPIVHLANAEVPIRYKVRRCPDRAKGESFGSWLERAEQALPSVIAIDWKT